MVVSAVGVTLGVLVGDPLIDALVDALADGVLAAGVLTGRTLVDTAPGNEVVFSPLVDTPPVADGVLVDRVNPAV